MDTIQIRIMAESVCNLLNAITIRIQDNNIRSMDPSNQRVNIIQSRIDKDDAAIA